MSNTSKILKSVALDGALTAAGTVATTTAHADTTLTNISLIKLGRKLGILIPRGMPSSY